MKALLKRHPKTTIIWAHTGPRPRRAPGAGQRGAAHRSSAILLEDPALAHVNFDISWDEVAKYLVGDAPQTVARVAALINRYPDRFLFGTDEVAPTDRRSSTSRVYEHVRAAVGRADARREREGAQGQLRAPVRRRPHEGQGLGERDMASNTAER